MSFFSNQEGVDTENTPPLKKGEKESIEFISTLSGVNQPVSDDLDTPLLNAAKRDVGKVVEEINKLKFGGGKDVETQLLYAFFSGPMPVPKKTNDPYAIAYNEIKKLAQEQILGGVFGSESEPRNPPLSTMELAMLRDAEMSPVLGTEAQARAMAAISGGVPPRDPRKKTTTHVVGDEVQQQYLSTTKEERIGENGISKRISDDSLSGPVSLSPNQVELGNGPPLEGYTLEKVIGKGVSGNVALGKDSENKSVVIKKIRLDPKKREESVDAVVRESSLQMFLYEQAKDSRIVCELKKVIVTEDAAYVILEACDGNLASKLANEPPDVDEAIDMLADIAEMYGQMHDLGITHRDIKMENLLVKGDKIFISDFGLSKSHHGGGKDVVLGEMTGMGSDTLKQNLISLDEDKDIVLLDEDKEKSPRSSKEPKNEVGEGSGKFPNMESSLKDDARKFALMIFESISGMQGFSQSELRVLNDLRPNFSPNFDMCANYAPPKPNCLQRCWGATDDPTRFSRLINALGELARANDPSLMAGCAKKLRAIVFEFSSL